MAPVKILIVDDRPENLLALEAALADTDYELVRALSGFEALEKAGQDDFALILLDVQMPVMDGFETAARIRSETRARYTPIIFVTAIDRTETYEQKGYRSGAVDYLFKPINTEILRAKVAVFVELYLQKHEIQRQAERIHARDEFLSIASHELKTPITPLGLQMESFIELFKNGEIDRVPRERLIRMLETSYSQVDRLSRLINDLLDVSRMTSKTLKLERNRTNLAKLVEDVVAGYGQEIQRSGCALTLSLERDVEGDCDKFRIEQVLINLLINATKYGAGKPIEIIVRKRPPVAQLIVKDHGIGISKEDQQRIFDRFERAVSARHFGGLGLGLYIANQIVKLHGGSIVVESTPGQGAEFSVQLPMN